MNGCPNRPTTPAVLLTLLALSACTSGGSGPSRAESENEFAARTLMAMLASGDAEDVAGLFHPDAVYDDFANQEQYRGLEEIAGYIAGSTRWVTGVSMDVLELHLSDSHAVAEWVFTGIQDRPIGSLVPEVTGREVVVNGVTILEMEGGRIRRAADYVDALPLVLQLGGEVRMPGGGVLRQEVAPPPDEPTSPDEAPDHDTLPPPTTRGPSQEPS